MNTIFSVKYLLKSVWSFVHNILMIGFREPINACDLPQGYARPDLSARVYRITGVSAISMPTLPEQLCH